MLNVQGFYLELYLIESCNLHIRRREKGGDMILNRSVLKRALNHAAHWRRPGLLFLNRHLTHCRGKVSTSTQFRSNYIWVFTNITVAVKLHFNTCLPTEFKRNGEGRFWLFFLVHFSCCWNQGAGARVQVWTQTVLSASWNPILLIYLNRYACLVGPTWRASSEVEHPHGLFLACESSGSVLFLSLVFEV